MQIPDAFHRGAKSHWGCVRKARFEVVHTPLGALCSAGGWGVGFQGERGRGGSPYGKTDVLRMAFPV